MSPAIKIFHSIEKNPQAIQDNLRTFLNNKELNIKKVTLLKKKLIINSQYKITALLHLEKSYLHRMIVEIHDHSDYFNRNIFALTHFKGLSPTVRPAKLFGHLKKEKILFREYLEGDFLFELLNKKEIKYFELKTRVKELAIFLARVHNLKIEHPPFYLSKNLNQKIEKIILHRTQEFIKPNIEFLRTSIEKNLKGLLKKMDTLDKINKICLIHGDYQMANAIFKNKDTYITDFDTVEIGNPGRDLGRFVLQINFSLRKFYSEDEIKNLEKIFLNTYLKNSKLKLHPNLKPNISLHQAEMIQYIILGIIWGKKVPSHEQIIEIQKLLETQHQLLRENGKKND